MVVGLSVCIWGVVSRTHELMAQRSVKRPQAGNVRGLRGPSKSNPSRADKLRPALQMSNVAVGDPAAVQLMTHPLRKVHDVFDPMLNHADLA